MVKAATKLLSIAMSVEGSNPTRDDFILSENSSYTAMLDDTLL